MRISTMPSNMFIQSMQMQNKIKRKAPLADHTDMSQQKHNNQYTIKSKINRGLMNIEEKKHIEMIERVAKALISPAIEIQCSKHENTGQISIKVIDRESREVIRDISPEGVFDMVIKLNGIAGLFTDEKKA